MYYVSNIFILSYMHILSHRPSMYVYMHVYHIQSPFCSFQLHHFTPGLYSCKVGTTKSQTLMESVTDHGMLFQIRNLLIRQNVGEKPKKDFNAHEYFFFWWSSVTFCPPVTWMIIPMKR